MHIGLNGKSYYGTAGAEAATEITAIQDVSLNIEVNAVEGSSRASVWKQAAAGLRGWTAEFSLLWDGTNASQTALQTAALAGTKTAFKFTDAASGYGYYGDAIITKFGFDQPLEDGMSVPVSLVSDGALTAESPAA